jgi:hypothetical protein
VEKQPVVSHTKEGTVPSSVIRGVRISRSVETNVRGLFGGLVNDAGSGQGQPSRTRCRDSTMQRAACTRCEQKKTLREKR